MKELEKTKSPSLAALARGGARSTPAGWKALLLPAALLAGLPAFLVFAFRDSLRPAVAVETARALLLDTPGASAPSMQAAPAEMLFQASGWVEPDAWPVRVSVLADGTVREVLVKEGERVQAGQLVARMDETDARLSLEARRSEHAAIEAGVAAQRAAVSAAEARLQAARAALPAARARLEESEEWFERISTLDPDETTPVEMLEARTARAVHHAERTAAEEALRAHEEELRQAQAMLARETAAREASSRQVEIAEVRLARMAVYAPANGMVQRRFVEPGAKRGVMMDDPDSATIVTLFDPDHLQVRVDVPLAEAGRLRVGQAAHVFSALLGGTMVSGTVTRIAGEADMQRNTLQAKVALHDPDPRLRPEVLCRVEFWSSPDEASLPKRPGEGSPAVWVPVAALQDPASAQTEVWVVDPDARTADRRAVRLAPDRIEDLRRVEKGLRPNELLVIGNWERLKPGLRVEWNMTTGETP